MATSRHGPKISAVDKHVCARVRERRIELSIDQKALADALGVTFQQIQKYERGVNRIYAGRLWQLADKLNVPVAFFFEGLDGGGKERAERAAVTRFIAEQGGMEVIRLWDGTGDGGRNATLAGLRELVKHHEIIKRREGKGPL